MTRKPRRPSDRGSRPSNSFADQPPSPPLVAANYPTRDDYVAALRGQLEQAPRADPLARSPYEYGAKRTPELEEIFLGWLRKGYTLKVAAEQTGISTRTAGNWRKAPRPDWRPEGTPTFDEAWAEAMDEGTDLLEEEAWRRGVDGVDEPVFQGGKQVGVVRRYSDSLLLALLHGRRATYRNAPGRGEVTVTINIVSVPTGCYVNADQAQQALLTDHGPGNGNGYDDNGHDDG